MTATLHTRPAIDVHVHVHPAIAQVMVDIMDANNLIGIANLGVLERRGIAFDEGMRTFRKKLGDRMVYLTTPDFGDTSPGFGERMAKDLERKVEAGARGLKIFKELGLRYTDADGKLIPVDDPRLDPLWARAGELDVPVLIHTADPAAFFKPLDEKNERWEELQQHPDWHFGRPEFPDHDTLLTQRNRAIERHPHTTFIGAHLGNYPENLGYVARCLKRYPNFYVDTSARIGEIGRHRTRKVRSFFIKHQDRILFGTDLVLGWNPLKDVEASQAILAKLKRSYDAHWRFFETKERQIEYPGYPIQGRWKVNAINLPDDVLDKLYVRNAQRLLHLKPV